MDTTFCVDALQEALRADDQPEIFNTDQGAHGCSTPGVDGPVYLQGLLAPRRTLTTPPLSSPSLSHRALTLGAGGPASCLDLEHD